MRRVSLILCMILILTVSSFSQETDFLFEYKEVTPTLKQEELLEEKSDSEMNYMNYVQHNDEAEFINTDICNHEHLEISEYVEDDIDCWYEGTEAYCPACGYLDNNYNNSRVTYKK